MNCDDRLFEDLRKLLFKDLRESNEVFRLYVHSLFLENGFNPISLTKDGQSVRNLELSGGEVKWTILPKDWKEAQSSFYLYPGCQNDGLNIMFENDEGGGVELKMIGLFKNSTGHFVPDKNKFYSKIFHLEKNISEKNLDFSTLQRILRPIKSEVLNLSFFNFDKKKENLIQGNPDPLINPSFYESVPFNDARPPSNCESRINLDPYGLIPDPQNIGDKYKPSGMHVGPHDPMFRQRDIRPGLHPGIPRGPSPVWFDPVTPFSNTGEPDPDGPPVPGNLPGHMFM